MRFHHRYGAAAAATLLLAWGARAEEAVRASGTGSALGAMQALAGAFREAHPDLRLVLLASVGSSGALRAVADGALDVGLSGRPLTPKERAVGLAEVAYARTPFVFAVGPRSRLAGVRAEEVVRIYRGELVVWPDGERIRLVLRPHTDVDTEIVRGISPDLARAVEVAESREGMLLAATNQECNEMLLRTPGAFGPTSLTQIVTEGRPVRALSWNGVEPTLANLASGAYPIAKTMRLVYRAPATPRVRAFLDFLASRRARAILEQTGNQPLLTPG